MTGAETAVLSPAFPPEEYEARLVAARAAMKERALTTLVLASPEDIFYLVGLNHAGYFAVTLLILPAEGPPLLVARGMERGTVRLQAAGCAHVAYEDGQAPATAAIDALRRAGPGPGAVGVDRSSMYFPVEVWEVLREALADVRWADASGLITGLRTVKSPREIEYVRRAAEISDRALQAGLATAGEGVSEREVATAVYAELIGAGSDVPGVPPMIRTTPTLELEHLTWSARRLQPGDALFIELAASAARYHAPMSRIAHVGAAAPALSEIAADVLAGFEAVVESVGPGVPAGDVYDAWQTTVNARLGHSRYRRHHCGYITGLGFPPSWTGGGTPVSLRPGSDLKLREGMIFHLFSWIFGQRAADYGVSDTAVVTSRGCELLTTTGRDPVRLGTSR